MGEVAELHATVHGYVQGVGFRFWTQREASRLGLTGWVANRPDGTVELIAQGPRRQLLDLLGELTGGRTPGSVETVDSDLADPSQAFAGFEIRR